MLIKFNYKMLIIDNDQDSVFALKTLINKHISTEVIVANDTQSALVRLNKEEVDLIILDIDRVGIDGWEIVAFVKERKKGRDIPIIFLVNSHKHEAFKKRDIKRGDVDYLIKPVDGYQLINRISVYFKLMEKEKYIDHMVEERVKKETEELRRAKEQAEAESESKSIFLTDISHELRTPLNIILSSVQLIDLYLDSETAIDKNKFKKKLYLQKQNCYRLLRLVNNLIDITKIDAGHFTMKFRRYNIVELVESITMSIGPYMDNKGIQLIFDTEVEEREIFCDLDAIERIMLNLLSNAVKFTPTGGIVHVKLDDMGDYIKIAIKDTGIGIQRDMLDKVFERFRQGNNLLTGRNEGSGIGLNLVKHLVEKHKGRIYVRSEYNKGSEFIVELPVANGQQETEFGVCHEYKVDNNVVQKINIEFSDIYM